MDMEAPPLPPPPPLRTRFAVAKRLPRRSSRKRPTDELPLAPLKALKASPGSFAHWVAEAQAAIQHGVASVRVAPKGPAAQGGVAEVAPMQTREGALLPRGGEAHESDRAGVPLVAEAPGVFEAEATEATAPMTAETAVATVGVSASAEATMAEAEAPETVEAIAMAAMPSVQEAEMKVAEALVAPLELKTRSLGKSVFLRWERGVWDQLQRQKGLLAGANEPLSARSAEVEDLRLRCADTKVKAAMAQAQLAPLAARVKELEEELTRVVSDQDAFRGRAVEATASAAAHAGQLGVEQRAHQLTKGALDEALAAAEASRTEAVIWRGTVEGEF
ncbi:uncharacterized protein [Miscanthus floridulus]|uniref:uncharacterized protein n=1 Tax=Miscanthus floridulus TaxID=154761 RepID=UPI0034597577